MNWGSPETPTALALVRFVRDVLIQDPEYVERIKRHYGMFREKIEGVTDQPWWKKKRLKI